MSNLQSMLEYNELVKPLFQITDEESFNMIASKAVDGTYMIPASMSSSGNDEYIDINQN